MQEEEEVKEEGRKRKWRRREGKGSGEEVGGKGCGRAEERNEG